MLWSPSLLLVCHVVALRMRNVALATVDSLLMLPCPAWLDAVYAVLPWARRAVTPVSAYVTPVLLKLSPCLLVGLLKPYGCMQAHRAADLSVMLKLCTSCLLAGL